VVRLLRSMPLIWTNTDVVPIEFVTVQTGPGGFQPAGVVPLVSHLLAWPPMIVVVMPGLKGLALKDGC